MRYIIIFILLSLLTGCFPEDKIVLPIDINIVEIPFSTYDNQVWYSLKDNTVASHNSFTEWDLGFESNGSGHHIILNTSRFMHAGNSGSTDFNGVTGNICDTMIYDDSSGKMDKTAIGNWADFTDPDNPVYAGYVYIIDLGRDNSGAPYGFRKVVFESFSDNSYRIHFSNLDGTDDHHSEIPVDAEKTFTFFSFSAGGILAPVQPVNSSWDLCFTQYSTILFDDNNIATPYLVRGVYLNTEGTTAVADSISSFSSITIKDVDKYTFSGSQDVIGYAWKDYKDDAYSIRPDIFYLIRDQRGVYYKLKFTGFYNSSGARGYPSFQVVNLSN